MMDSVDSKREKLSDDDLYLYNTRLERDIYLTQDVVEKKILDLVGNMKGRDALLVYFLCHGGREKLPEPNLDTTGYMEYLTMADKRGRITGKSFL